MELTRERIEELMDKSQYPDTRTMAKMLLYEIDKPKVWYGSPDYAGRAIVTFEKGGRDSEAIWSKVYTRTLPKSRIDEIAEDAEDRYRRGSVGAGSLTDIIKSAIFQARKEWEGEI